MAGSMSICTARACPSFGRNSDHGKPVPIMSSVSQPFIMSELGLRAEQPDRAGDERQIVGKNRLAEQGLGDAGAQRSATAMTSSAASARPRRSGLRLARRH